MPLRFGLPSAVRGALYGRACPKAGGAASASTAIAPTAPIHARPSRCFMADGLTRHIERPPARGVKPCDSLLSRGVRRPGTTKALRAFTKNTKVLGDIPASPGGPEGPPLRPSCPWPPRNFACPALLRSTYRTDSPFAVFVPSWLPEGGPELLRRARLDRPAVPEHGDIEIERRQLPQASPAVLQALVAERVAESRHVRARVRREEQAAARPEQRNLPGALPRDVNRFQAAGNRQFGAVVDLLIDRARVDRRRLLRDEEPVHHAAQQARRGRHRARGFAFPHHRGVGRVHVDARAAHALQRRHAARVIRMAVRDDDVLEVGDLLPDRLDGGDDLSLAVRCPRIDERQAAGIDQERVHSAEVDLPETLEDLGGGGHGAELSAKPFLAWVLGSRSRGCRPVTLTATYCCCPNMRAQYLVVCPLTRQTGERTIALALKEVETA